MPTDRRPAGHDFLPGPFATPPPADGVRPTPATHDLVRAQVDALLTSSPGYHALDAARRRELADDMVKIGAYTAALIQDDWAQSKRLGQTPLLRQRVVSKAAAASEEFDPRAASNVAPITRDTLNAIAFPTFVADLVKGTFNAIVNASIQQMEAYGQLLANVAKTVDQFMADNITDNQARDYLAQSYPAHFRVDTGGESPRLRVRDKADDQPKPDFKGGLGVTEDVSLDDDAAEEVLVPAARRKLAQSRHQLLSTMVLMGINRIVVTSGRIRATMGFRINARDTATAQAATQFDLKNEVKGSYGGGLMSLFGGPSFEVKNSIAYVSTSKKESSDDLNVSADLTGEVDLKFKSDYFPLERFADSQAIQLIQGNTPNPAANTPAAANTKEAAPVA